MEGQREPRRLTYATAMTINQLSPDKLLNARGRASTAEDAYLELTQSQQYQTRQYYTDRET